MYMTQPSSHIINKKFARYCTVSRNFTANCIVHIKFISGGSLVDALRLLEGKLLPVDQVCSIMYQTAKAVQHMQVLYPTVYSFVWLHYSRVMVQCQSLVLFLGIV